MSLDNAQEKSRVVARLAPVDKLMSLGHFCELSDLDEPEAISKVRY